VVEVAANVMEWEQGRCYMGNRNEGGAMLLTGAANSGQPLTAMPEKNTDHLHPHL